MPQFGRTFNHRAHEHRALEDSDDQEEEDADVLGEDDDDVEEEGDDGDVETMTLFVTFADKWIARANSSRQCRQIASCGVPTTPARLRLHL